MPIDDDRPTDTPIGAYLEDEFKALNAHIPRRRKTLAELLKETHPHVQCSDGSIHTFRKKELMYIAEILDDKEQEFLMLPMLMEISPSASAVTIRSTRGIEAKILSEVLDMDVEYGQNRVTVYRIQLGIIRRALTTSTQYVFTP